MKTVLIVDDHRDIRNLLVHTLKKKFNTVEASDAYQALFFVRTSDPDLVLLDLMLPGELDGWHALHEIKLRSPKTLVAVLSARGNVADHDRARAMGALAYFTKPFSPLAVSAWASRELAKS